MRSDQRQARDQGRQRRPVARRAFTLVEVMIAVVITAFVLGSLSMSMSQLARAKDNSKTRLDAYMRADMALESIRRDITSVIRHDDLYWTRLLVRDGLLRSSIGELDRDEILVFSTRLRAMNDLDFNGEGAQYETQYRIEEDELGAMLWQRRDPVPDEFPLAGGVATPLVDGIISLRIEAYDGFGWFQEWDSDEKGLPLAVRVTLVASGSRNGDDLYDGPFVTLRTVMPIDRVVPPADIFRLEDEELEAIEDEEGLEDVSDPTAGQGGESERGGARGGGRGGRGTGATPDGGGRGGAGGAGGRGGGRSGPGGQGGGQPMPNSLQGRPNSAGPQ